MGKSGHQSHHVDFRNVVKFENAQQSKATVVKRERKPLEGRDAMLEALRNKGQKGLRKVEPKEEKPKEEKVDATIFAILNRRQFMGDDSDSESGSSWDESSSD